MRKTPWLAAITVIATITALTACSSPSSGGGSPSSAEVSSSAAGGTQSSTDAGPAPSNITIALVYGIRGDPFYITMQKGAQAKADALGITLTADGPAAWDPALQAPIVDAMTAKKVSAMIVVPNDPQAMIAPLQRAFDNGIPLATTDQYIGDGDYANGSVTFPLSFIASDNKAGGKLACETLIDAIGGKGEIYILVSTANVPSDTARRDGCLEAIDATNGAVTSAGVDYTKSSATTATQQTQAKLQQDPKVSAIFGGNTFSAQGAAAAVTSAGLSGEIKVASFDAPEAAIDSLRAGTFDIVIAQQPAMIGATAVQALYNKLTGADPGPKKVAVPFVVITRDNVDSPEAQAAIYKSS